MGTPVGLRVLADARGFVDRGWCQHTDARDAAGAEVEPWDERAVAWSLLGAIVAVLEREARERGEVPLEELAASLYALADVVDVDSLAEWNDAPGRTKEQTTDALAQAQKRFETPWPANAEFNPN
jgi:hypothetical protein